MHVRQIDRNKYHCAAEIEELEDESQQTTPTPSETREVCRTCTHTKATKIRIHKKQSAQSKKVPDLHAAQTFATFQCLHKVCMTGLCAIHGWLVLHTHACTRLSLRMHAGLWMLCRCLLLGTSTQLCARHRSQRSQISVQHKSSSACTRYA